jgi:hypothetical protein
LAATEKYSVAYHVESLSAFSCTTVLTSRPILTGLVLLAEAEEKESTVAESVNEKFKHNEK